MAGMASAPREADITPTGARVLAYLSMNSIVSTSAAGGTLNRPV
jgi:hypothetical protein